MCADNRSGSWVKHSAGSHRVVFVWRRPGHYLWNLGLSPTRRGMQSSCKAISGKKIRLNYHIQDQVLLFQFQYQQVTFHGLAAKLSTAFRRTLIFQGKRGEKFHKIRLGA